jgi:hypothetical protein
VVLVVQDQMKIQLQRELMVVLQHFLILHQLLVVEEEALLAFLEIQVVQAVADQVTEVQVE